MNRSSPADYKVTEKTFAFATKRKVRPRQRVHTRLAHVALQLPFFFCSASDGTNVVTVSPVL